MKRNKLNDTLNVIKYLLSKKVKYLFYYQNNIPIYSVLKIITSSRGILFST